MARNPAQSAIDAGLPQPFSLRSTFCPDGNPPRRPVVPETGFVAGSRPALRRMKCPRTSCDKPAVSCYSETISKEHANLACSLVTVIGYNSFASSPAAAPDRRLAPRTGSPSTRCVAAARPTRCACSGVGDAAIPSVNHEPISEYTRRLGVRTKFTKRAVGRLHQG